MSKDFRVQCRGLPWETTEDEVKNFFGNSGIQDVDIPRRNGRVVGEATVTFTNEDDYKAALKKDREHLGSRYIEVFTMDSAPRRRFERDDSYRPRGGPPRDRFSDRGGGGGGGGRHGPDSVVRLRGLPFSVTVRDITDFLAPLPIVRDGVLLPDQHRGRPGGEAYVCFETMESVQIAKQRHMKNIGHRYIEVFEASFRELSRFCDDHGLRVPRFGPPPFVSPPAQRGGYDQYGQDSYRSGGGGGGYSREPEDPYGRSSYGGGGPQRTAGYDPYQQQAAPAVPAQNSYGSSGYGGYESYGGATGGYGRDSRDPRDPRMMDPRDPRDAREMPRERPQDLRPTDPRGAAPVDPYTGEPRYPEYGASNGGVGVYGGTGGGTDAYWRGGGGGGSSAGPQAGTGAPAARDPYAGGGDSWASSGGGASADRFGGGYPNEPYAQREAGGAMRRSEYGRPDDRYSKPEPYGYGRDRQPDYSAARQSAAPQGSQQFILRMRGIPFRATEADVFEFFLPSRPNHVELLRDAYQRMSGDARVIFYSRKDYDDALMKDKQYMGERYIEIIPDNGRY